MKYSEAQEEARSLGLKYVGVSKHNLVKSIERAKSEKQNMNVDTTPLAPEVLLTSVESLPITTPEEDKKLNVAIVKNKNKQEIRRYTKEIHGEKFVELANEFANDREYVVELSEVKKNLICPKCGHMF